MTVTTNSEQHGIEDRKQYRQMMDRLMGIGAVGLIIVTAVWWLFLPEDMVIFVGLGIYCLSILGYVAIWPRTGVRLFDEREQGVEQKAARAVMIVMTFVVILGLPADIVFEVTDAVTLPPFLRGIIWGYTLLMSLFLIASGYFERRHS